MAKNIMVPCDPCKEKILKGVNDKDKERGITTAPTRNIVGGKLVSEGEDADFQLELSCGHTIDFTFSQEEKEDVVELLSEVEGEPRGEVRHPATAAHPARAEPAP